MMRFCLLHLGAFLALLFASPALAQQEPPYTTPGGNAAAPVMPMAINPTTGKAQPLLTKSTVGDTSIVAGGSPVVLFGGAVPVHGWKVANPNPSDDLWCSDSTATPAANGAGSVRIVANGGQYATEPWEIPAGPVYCVGATAGDLVVARGS